MLVLQCMLEVSTHSHPLTQPECKGLLVCLVKHLAVGLEATHIPVCVCVCVCVHSGVQVCVLGGEQGVRTHDMYKHPSQAQRT